jgi:hypothetical protein
MIALVILGLGLLFIAAALPVGLEYTRQTVDLTDAEAAGQYALDQLELNLRTSKSLYDRSLFVATAGVSHRLDNIHRPRDMVPGQVGNPTRYVLRPTYEPVMKVRPLALGNIGMSLVGTEPSGASRGAELADNAEAAISLYLNSVWGVDASNLQTVRREYEFPYDGSNSFNDRLSLVNNPVLPGLARVYPPIEPVTTFSVAKFFDLSDNQYPTYAGRYRDDVFPDPSGLHREREKAIDRRLACTAFYRRISYKGDNGPDDNWYTNDDIADNPLLYELIVVVTRRTSVRHRFPLQNLNSPGLATFEDPNALSPTTTDDLVGVDRLAPTPWLVTFDSTPQDGGDWVTPVLTPGPGNDYVSLGTGPSFERVLTNNFTDPPTLTFRCTRRLGALLPEGSIFIPAANDQRYVPTGLPQQVGFVPSAPESLPIYEVVERPDDTTVVVKNNGYYPWLAPGLTAQAWPVWIIPPAFAERYPGLGPPIYDDSSPILHVFRRTVTLRELP